jgi:hypothetical protein
MLIRHETIVASLSAKKAAWQDVEKDETGAS